MASFSSSLLSLASWVTDLAVNMGGSWGQVKGRERSCKMKLRAAGGDLKVLPGPQLRAPQILVNTSSTPTIASYLHISNLRGGSLLHSQVFPWQPLGDRKHPFFSEWTAFVLLANLQLWCPSERSAPWTEDHSQVGSPFSNSLSLRALLCRT